MTRPDGAAMLRYRNAVYIRAYLEPQVAQLKRYLEMDDLAKAKDLLVHTPVYLFWEWLNEVGEDEMADFIEDETSIEPDVMENNISDEIALGFLRSPQAKEVRGRDTDAPSWVYFSDPVLLRNQWLIHFTKPKNLESIKQNGFMLGEKNYRDLGLTVYKEHHGPGFNFAFLLDDFWNYKRVIASRTFWGYGDACVLFRASGVLAYHNGDEQNQAIFWGPSARDIVGLDHPAAEWVLSPCGSTGNKLPHFTDLRKATAWVTSNYNQYRSVLSCR